MGLFHLGADRVGIVTDVQDLDGDGLPVVSEYSQPQTHEVVVWADDALFEPVTRDIFEQAGFTVTTSEPAFVFLPLVDGQIPTVDDNGQPAPTAVLDLKVDRKLRFNDRTYSMRGDAVPNRTIRGRDDHVFCACDRKQG